MAEESLLRFRLGREVYAVRVRDAGFLVDLSGISTVPRVPAVIAGLADVHGRVVTLVDLARVSGGASGTAPERALVLAPPHDHLGLLVADEVDLLTLDLGRSQPGRAGDLSTDSVPLSEILTEEGLLMNLVDPAALAGDCAERVRDRFRTAV